MQKIDVPQQFDWSFQQTLLLQILPETLLGRIQRKEELAERDALFGTAYAQPNEALLNFRFGLCQQPIPQIAIDFVRSHLKFLAGYFVEQVTATFRSFEPLN